MRDSQTHFFPPDSFFSAIQQIVTGTGFIPCDLLIVGSMFVWSFALHQQLFNGDSSQNHVSWTTFNKYFTSSLSRHWWVSHSDIPIILSTKGESHYYHFKEFGLSRQRIKPTTSHSRGGRSNHYAFTVVMGSMMFLWECSQWHGKNIVQSTSKNIVGKKGCVHWLLPYMVTGSKLLLHSPTFKWPWKRHLGKHLLPAFLLFLYFCYQK